MLLLLRGFAWGKSPEIRGMSGVLHSQAQNPAVPAWAVSFWSLNLILHSRVPDLKVMLGLAAAPRPDTSVGVCLVCIEPQPFAARQPLHNPFLLHCYG